MAFTCRLTSWLSCRATRRAPCVCKGRDELSGQLQPLVRRHSTTGPKLTLSHTTDSTPRTKVSKGSGADKVDGATGHDGESGLRAAFGRLNRDARLLHWLLTSRRCG